MIRIVFTGVCVAVLSATWLLQAEQAPTSTQAGDDPRFTGKNEVLEPAGLAVSRRRFEAGARTAWHSHERGQLIFVEEGRLRIQRRGEPGRELRKGESDYTGANVVHWHGAAPEEPLVHVAVTFGGADTKWLEKTTDAEYRSIKK